MDDLADGVTPRHKVRQSILEKAAEPPPRPPRPVPAGGRDLVDRSTWGRGPAAQDAQRAMMALAAGQRRRPRLPRGR